jgi:predicted type IV restriction endonuclease
VIVSNGASAAPPAYYHLDGRQCKRFLAKYPLRHTLADSVVADGLVLLARHQRSATNNSRNVPSLRAFGRPQMTDQSKLITVMVKQDVPIDDVAARLKALGVDDVQLLVHIACITGKWKGAISEVKKVKGVEDVEEQTGEYFPS